MCHLICGTPGPVLVVSIDVVLETVCVISSVALMVLS